MPAGKITFQFRAEHDVLVAVVDWRIDSEDDLKPWYDAYADYFRAHFRRKVDVIFDLTRFHLSPRIARRFGEVRAELLREFTDRTYRVSLTPAVRVAMYTSHVLHGAPANEFPSIDAALAQLHRDRAKRA